MRTDTATARLMAADHLPIPTHPWVDGFEPPILHRRDLDHLLTWAYACEIGDITLTSDEPPAALIDGQYERLGQRTLSRQELDGLLMDTFGANGPSVITAGHALDFAYEIHLSRKTRIRFRVNAVTGRTQYTTAGCAISLRTIRDMPQTVEELGVESVIVEASRNVSLSQGVVLTVGATGTGKSTLQAALLRDTLARRPALKVVTVEAPIEFVLSTAPEKVGIVVQYEVPTHTPSFAEGIRNAMRQKPNVILLGEARDTETFNELLTAGVTGHAVYSTTHAPSIAGAFKRVVGMYPPSEQRGLIATFLDVMRLCITQRLVPRVGGGRVALREYLVFDQATRVRLAQVDPDRLALAVHTEVADKGQTLLMDAQRKHDEGLISTETLAIIEAEWRDFGAVSKGDS